MDQRVLTEIEYTEIHYHEGASVLGLRVGVDKPLLENRSAGLRKLLDVRVTKPLVILR
jgi:hypothetical protein